jgi:hypothetical protein
MKIHTLLTLIFTLITSQVLAGDIIDRDLDLNLKTKKTDDRESIQKVDFTKLFSKAKKLHDDAKAWEKIKCEPKSGFICTKHSCNKRQATYSLVLDKENETITRCEGENCETFAAEFEQTGVFFNISTKGPIGTLIRVLGDYRYKEITTVALDAYIANGECVVVND